MNVSINHLFPPDEILKLPTWRFVLHFCAPSNFHDDMLRKAIDQLKTEKWKIITFSRDLSSLFLDENSKSVIIPIEVSEDKRYKSNSLNYYESDVWKIIGNMIECGFGDIYYEAVDWRE